jgi:hypothetical protein
MQDYSIIGISGSVNPFIIETFKLLGVNAEYNVDRPLTDNQTAIIITYGHGGYAWVMTGHFFNHVQNMSPIQINNWKKCWVGGGEITSSKDITPDRWAKHVLESHKHIGLYAPLNGLYNELEKRICNDNCPRYEIKLEDIVSNPEKALSDIGYILNKEIPDNVKEYFLNEHKKMKELMAPWMNAIVLENGNSQNLTINHFGYTIHVLID